MDQSVLALASGATGAVIGLLAPVISSALTQRGANAEGQRLVANEILDILSDAQPLDRLLGGRHSSARRKLYVLGIRLRDKAAREACADLVVAAGQDGAGDHDLYPSWSRAIGEVSRISRRNR